MDRPVRSPNPMHQCMNVGELRDAVETLASISHLFGLQGCLSSHVEKIGNLQEWAEDHQDKACFEIEDIVAELESRRGLTDDEAHERDNAIMRAWNLIRHFGRFDCKVERKEVPHG